HTRRSPRTDDALSPHGPTSSVAGKRHCRASEVTQDCGQQIGAATILAFGLGDEQGIEALLALSAGAGG
ncbi:Hypothetical predicted protein, partial [Pelobates cultripes]